jgi:hypothetical protein
MEHTTSAKIKNNGSMQSIILKINRGIFQSDLLSPLLVCIELIPLSHVLSRPKCGTERKISHLLHMDDLKLIERSEAELRKEIRIVKK